VVLLVLVHPALHFSSAELARLGQRFARRAKTLSNENQQSLLLVRRQLPGSGLNFKKRAHEKILDTRTRDGNLCSKKAEAQAVFT
jgi:hypothetical protein